MVWIESFFPSLTKTVKFESDLLVFLQDLGEKVFSLLFLADSQILTHLFDDVVVLFHLAGRESDKIASDLLNEQLLLLLNTQCLVGSSIFNLNLWKPFSQLRHWILSLVRRFCRCHLRNLKIRALPPILKTKAFSYLLKICLSALVSYKWRVLWAMGCYVITGCFVIWWWDNALNHLVSELNRLQLGVRYNLVISKCHHVRVLRPSLHRRTCFWLKLNIFSPP